MTAKRLRIAALSLIALPSAAQAQGASAPRPPIRQLGPVQATSTDTLVGITNIRAMSTGHLLVNDVLSRRVLLMDSSFKVVSVVADSTSSTANAYGPRSGALIAYKGDSTLFVDAASLSMLVVDPAGKIGRIMSVPRSQDAMMLAAGGLGAGAFFSEGHLVYRGMPGIQMRMGSNGQMAMPAVPDTMPIVRVNLATRVVDTAGFLKIPKTNTNINRSDDGKISVSIEINPLPVVDEWVVTSTGQVAIIRGKDYHVDWMAPNGTKSATAKMPFDWKRMTDDEKVALIDSVKAIRERQAAANPGQGTSIAQAFGAMMGTGGGAFAAMAGGPPGGGGGGGAQVMVRMGGPGGAAPAGGAPTVVTSGGGGGRPQINMTYVSPSDLPDYRPPFFATSAKADADGNIWLRTISAKPVGGEVYDVINAKGEIIDRVQVPEGRTILGFGPGGVVIMARNDGAVTRLERARTR